MAYKIHINEQQRHIIYQALTLAASTTNVGLDRTEVTNLMDLFHTLPKDETETPGVLHGFCL